MPQYMLLIKGGTDSEISAEQAQKIVEQYIAWARSLRDNGQYIAGDELAPSGRIMTVQNGKIVDGPFTETKESVGGYFIVEAKDYAEAVEISKGCPTFQREGVLEIREIVDHSG